jgi:lipoprotein-anchoring transpeptidase ErfK/SrfK
MTPNDDEAYLAVQNARQALRENRRSDARKWAEHAARLAPQMEDPWLVLAAIANPQASLKFIQRALEINPNSPRARRGMEWALQRLSEQPSQAAETQESFVNRLPTATPLLPSAPPPAKRTFRQLPTRALVPIILVGIGLLVCVVAGASALMSPVVASILQQTQPTQMPSWALAYIPKPTYTPDSPLAEELQPTLAIDLSPTPASDVPTDVPAATVQPTESLSEQPTAAATEAPTGEATSEPPTAEPVASGLELTYVDSVPTVEAPPSGDSNAPGVHWIDVNLSQQMVYAYAGDTVVNSFLVSTGTWLHPTVTGKYHVYVKYRYTDMTGPDYYLPNVPYTMYFYKGYGLHGTYWHHNFGTPMSHGCVNLSIPDAQWLYSFSSVGTLVNVHY